MITANQSKAVIKQGIEIPYQEASSSGATSVAFKEAVLKLEVTPQITPEDSVILDLEIQKDEADFTRSVLGVPPVNTQSVETSVLVENGETVALAGCSSVPTRLTLNGFRSSATSPMSVSCSSRSCGGTRTANC